MGKPTSRSEARFWPEKWREGAGSHSKFSVWMKKQMNRAKRRLDKEIVK